MKIRFYKTEDSQNTVNKTLEILTEIDITFRRAVNERGPQLIIHSNSIPAESNYVEIPAFNRFYFMQVDPFNNQLVNLSLTCDFLMTYKDSILNGTSLITAKETPSYYASSLPTTNKAITKSFESTVTLPKKNTMILTTIGGTVNG